MAKVLVLNGSPREKGNTAFLVGKLGEMLRERGHSVDVLQLHELDIKPCRGCFWCYQGFPLRCVQDDVMNSIYPKVLETDLLVFASPIYWFNYSAQLKLFIDRLVALHVEGGHALDGRRFATIFVYGDRDPVASGVYTAIESIEHMISYFKGENLALVHSTGGDLLTVSDNLQLLEELEQLADKV